MRTPTRTIACLFGLLASATLLKSEQHFVFSVRGANDFETIRGALVLNRDAVRTVTPTGFRFETPVDFLHYTVSDASGIIDDFTLTAANPNTLTITKNADGSTRFFLIVEPVPTDPPFPMPPEFTMEFTFPGAAPWGDSVPDRSVVGATNVSLGASDLYDQSVSISEVAINELAKQLAEVNAELRRLRKSLAQSK